MTEPTPASGDRGVQPSTPQPPLGAPPPTGPVYSGPPPPGYPLPPAKSRLTAGLLGIFLGGFGVHRFYLGYLSMGVLQILVTIATCGIGALWGTVEGILILSGYRRLSTDAAGRPLRP